MRYWEILGEAVRKRTLFGGVLAGACAANVVMAGFCLSLELGPRYAVRTDREGHSDLVLLPRSVPAHGAEAERFIEELALRLFSWDDTTKESDRAYVRERVCPSVRERLGAIVPGYNDSLKKGTSGRLDVEVQTTQVIAETLPYQIEIHVAIEFSGQYVPPGLGAKDPTNPRREIFGFLFTLDSVERSRLNPSGLVVTGLTPVAVISTGER